MKKSYIKIPINTSVKYDATELIEYTLSKGFLPHVYLSGSKFTLRANQNNWDNFLWHIDQFKNMKYFMNLEIEKIELAFNSRDFTKELDEEIERTLKILADKRWNVKKDFSLILIVPKLIGKYSNLGYDVVVSSASINSFKKIIDYLIQDPKLEGYASEGAGTISYVLPSTYQFVLPYLEKVNATNTFSILLQNGCKRRCRNSGVVADHSKECPIQSKEWYFDPITREATDIITRKEFKNLIERGWTQFKISGRQASPESILETLKYYLDEKEPDTSLPVWIDNHTSYGESTNG